MNDCFMMHWHMKSVNILIDILLSNVSESYDQLCNNHSERILLHGGGWKNLWTRIICLRLRWKMSQWQRLSEVLGLYPSWFWIKAIDNMPVCSVNKLLYLLLLTEEIELKFFERVVQKSSRGKNGINNIWSERHSHTFILWRDNCNIYLLFYGAFVY